MCDVEQSDAAVAVSIFGMHRSPTYHVTPDFTLDMLKFAYHIAPPPG